jgi:predicted ABC-type exoprotein transport system permease subunit
VHRFLRVGNTYRFVGAFTSVEEFREGMKRRPRAQE